MGLNGESHVCKSPISNHFSLKTTPKEKKIKKLSKNLKNSNFFEANLLMAVDSLKKGNYLNSTEVVINTTDSMVDKGLGVSGDISASGNI